MNVTKLEHAPDNTCFFSGINDLPNTISANVISWLQGFGGLQTTKEIEQWHAFCRGINDQAVQSMS
jgi:hypothetical protein